MKHPLLVLTTALLFPAAAPAETLAPTLPAVAGTTGVQRTQLDTYRKHYVAAVLAGEAAPIVSPYVASVRLMPPYQKTVLGKTNADQFFRAFLKRFEIQEYLRTATELIDLGTKIAEFGQIRLKARSRSSGKVYDLPGKYLDLWMQPVSGSLMLETAAWNFDQPIESADDFRFAEIPAIQAAFQTHAPMDSEISFELEAIHALQEVVITNHEAKRWSRFFADDAVLYSNGGTISRGRQEIDEYLETHCKHLPIFEKLDLRNDRVEEAGDFVIEYASHVANWRTGEYSGVNTGKNIGFWRRSPRGPLKLFRQIGSYD